MATIARIIVTELGLPPNRKLLLQFIAASKTLLPDGDRHQFILLPGGFLKFFINDDLSNAPLFAPEYNTSIEVLKEQALTEFYQAFDNEILHALKSVANYVTIGIDSKGGRIQLVLTYDLQNETPLHWTGKTYPKPDERERLIKMPMESHFITIGGQRVAVFQCNDLSIFNQRHQPLFSPFADERRGAKRRDDTEAGKIKCPFIDATLDFNPDIMLHLPHSEGTWGVKFAKLNAWLRRKHGKGLQHFASGLSNPQLYPLSGTQGGDVINIANGKWVKGTE